MTADVLLARLAGVRPTGPGRWVGRCPAHADRRASLSVRELGDGRVLVHDFAGCAVADVLSAAGLTFRDLFAEPIDHAVKRVPRPYSLRDLATALGHELRVAFVILSDIANGKPIADVDRQRAAEAQRRIAHFLGELDHAG